MVTTSSENLEQGLCTAGPQDRRRVAELLARAFADDPAARWAFPDPDSYLEHFCRFVGAFAGEAFGRGTADCLGPYAAALWLPPDAHPDESAIIELIEEATPPERRPAVYSLFEQMNGLHPPEAHWHLPLIGVDPAVQGRGLGSRLLQARLEACDRAGQPAYLEATSQRNVPLYQRHGFESLGTVRAGSSPAITPMLRRPR